MTRCGEAIGCLFEVDWSQRSSLTSNGLECGEYSSQTDICRTSSIVLGPRTQPLLWPTQMPKPNRTGRGGKAPRHVRLYHWMTDSAAWHDLNAVARAIYCEMAKRYAGDGSNNGRIPYSIREAATELRISRTTASRALNLLEDHGFIVAVTKGAFSLKKRHATEWRLTEFPCDVTHTVSTKDFMRWRPSAKIQNAVSVAKLSGPVAKPNGTCGETDVAQKQRDGIRSETVSGNFHDSRFHQRDTTSLPGDRAVIPSGTARLRSEH